MKVLFLESDQVEEYNCSLWRCRWPARALLRAGYQAKVIRIEDWVTHLPEAVQATEEADLVILQRNLFADVLGPLHYWRDRGKVIAVDLDDAYEFMTAETGCPAYEFWANARQEDGKGGFQKLSPRPLSMLRWGVKIAGAMTAPSKLICEDWQPYAKSYWFPNFIDTDLYRRRDVYHVPNKILIGWGGSVTHLVSWTGSGLAQAIEKIVSEDKRVQLLLMGDPRVAKFVNIQPSKITSLGFMSQAEYGKKLSMMDIGVAPLSGAYDRRRSWLKGLEYMCLGIPWIATNYEPYRDILGGHLVENTTEAWYIALKAAIANLPELTEDARKGIDLAQEYSLDNNGDTLAAICETIINENTR